MKKIMVTVFLFLMFTVPCFSQSSGKADVILVLDISGSMRWNDPKNIAKTGINLFIDMLEYGSRAGVIAFNHKIAMNTNIQALNNNKDKNGLTSKVTALKYAGDTDIGLALTLANKVLSNSPGNNPPVIILLTDGKIDTGNKERDRVSHEEVNALLANPKTPIFTIALTASGKEDEVDLELINRIANRTNAKSYIAKNAASLPSIFNDIFSSIIKSEVVDVGKHRMSKSDFKEIPIEIPDAVAEVNVLIQLDKQMDELKLLDPRNTEVKLNSSQAYLTKSGSYSILKILFPVSGEWTLKMRGEGDVDINLTYNFDISLMAFTPKTKYSKGDKLSVVGKLVDKNGLELGEELLQNFKGRLYVVDSGVEIDNVSMNLSGKEFVGEYTLPEKDATFEFIVGIDGYKFYRTDSVKIRVGYQKPYIKPDNPL